MPRPAATPFFIEVTGSRLLPTYGTMVDRGHGALLDVGVVLLEPMEGIIISEGQTEFKPTGIKIFYPRVDLENMLVEARIEIEGSTKVRVITDLKTGEQKQEGNWDEVIYLSPAMDEEAYLRMFKEWASIFIENGIADPRQYFEQNK